MKNLILPWLFKLSVSCLGLSVMACHPPIHRFTASNFIMGTQIKLIIFLPADQKLSKPLTEISQVVFAEMARLEQVMNEQNPNSALAQAECWAGLKPIPINEDLLDVLQQAQQVSAQTQGVWDVSFKPLGRLWNVNQRQVPPDAKAIQSVLPLVNYKNILIAKDQKTLFLKKAGMAIGLGGIAKGYAASRAAEILTSYQVKNFIVALGGDLYLQGQKGRKHWRTGIQDPDHPQQLIYSFAVHTPLALSTSGNYQNYFSYQGQRYHHILDPRTGYPAVGLKSVTVLAPNPVQADAYATACFILGYQASLALVKKQPSLAFIMLDESNHTLTSPNLNQYLLDWQDHRRLK